MSVDSTGLRKPISSLVPMPIICKLPEKKTCLIFWQVVLELVMPELLVFSMLCIWEAMTEAHTTCSALSQSRICKWSKPENTALNNKKRWRSEISSWLDTWDILMKLFPMAKIGIACEGTLPTDHLTKPLGRSFTKLLVVSLGVGVRKWKWLVSHFVLAPRRQASHTAPFLQAIICQAGPQLPILVLFLFLYTIARRDKWIRSPLQIYLRLFSF